MKINKVLQLLLVALMFSCGTSKKMAEVESMPEVRIEMLDTLVVVPDASDVNFNENLSLERPKYNASETKLFEIIHTNLDVRFDWMKQYVIGSAELTLSPYFFAQKELILDAKGFEIKGVKNANSNKDLSFVYDGMEITIQLEKAYSKNEKVTIVIDYIAKPNEGEIGGSEAITSDKGLYFINPLNEIVGKPQQIWTQGETESNSKWFPTIDSPNQRSTQEISITVASKYSTLSNGIKKSSTENENGTRTDVWVQQKAHAPYLFMLAVGEFAWIEDQWNDLPLYYIVEEEYREDAKEIFKHTPEMLGFFSDILDYPYAWDKYAQIVTRDYVSGAMENTGAVIFGDFVQKHKRELIDDGNDYIVAHEMFHHWFGDLVTIESWANLTLNEGFANYSEYLWFEHKYGKDRADEHRIDEMAGYITSAMDETHPLIHFGYDSREDMFDAHSYNKGGLVLHMLRAYFGDEAFYAALHKYLVDNEFTSVEVDELRMAFEDVSGEDLNWFFDQWYLQEGHPNLDVSYDYDGDNVLVYVNQNQNHLYRIPFDLKIYASNGEVSTHRVWLDERSDTLIVNGVLEQPVSIVLDGGNDQLAVINEVKSEEAYFAQFKYSDELIDRMKAIQMLGDSDFLDEVVMLGLDDKYHLIRATSLDLMSPEVVLQNASKLEDMAINDAHSIVRISALGQLFVAREGQDMIDLLDQVFEKEQSYAVLSEAIGMIANQDIEKALVIADIYKNENTDVLANGIAYAYSQSEDPVYFDWFLDKVKNGNFYTIYPVYGMFSGYMARLDNQYIERGAQIFGDIALNLEEDVNRKFIAMNSLATLRTALTSGDVASDKIQVINLIGKIIDEVKSKETDPVLLGQYQQY